MNGERRTAHGGFGAEQESGAARGRARSRSCASGTTTSNAAALGSGASGRCGGRSGAANLPFDAAQNRFGGEMSSSEAQAAATRARREALEAQSSQITDDRERAEAEQQSLQETLAQLESELGPRNIGSSMPTDPVSAPLAVTAAPPPITPSAIAPTPIPPDATEEQLIGLWLHGKSSNTIRAYRRDIAAFRAFIGKPIRLATWATSNATLMRSGVRRHRAHAGSSS